jgi:hypothetical protein
MNGAYDDVWAALREQVHIVDLLQARGVPHAPLTGAVAGPPCVRSKTTTGRP